MKTFLPTLALLALCACAPEAPTAETPPPPVPAPIEAAAPIPLDASAGASGQDSMTWIQDRTGAGRLRLMYSARASDELGINVQCDSERVAHVLFVRYTPPPQEALETWPFTLASGDVRAELAGAVERGGSDEITINGAIGLDTPLMRAFRQSGRLSLEEGGRTLEMNAINGDERAAIERFFTACETY